MIRIHRSNKLDILASHLAEDLKTEAPEDPLVPSEVVVPNRDTARWLKLGLAESNSIIANVEFILPAEWQFRLIRKLYPGLPEVLPGDPGPLAWALYDIIMDDKARRQFPRPDRYVLSQPPEIKERAVMQLSKKIASVYDQYLVYRPEMLLKWQDGDPGDSADEKWQAQLWNLLEKKRRLKEKGVGFPNKAELIRETSDALRAGKISVEYTLMFFNTGLLPLPVLLMAQNAAESQNFILYQSAVSEKRSGNHKNNFLSAFGEEAVGMDVLLDKLNGEVQDEFVGASNKSEMLAAVQESIIFDGEIVLDSVSGTSGIEVHSCHTPLREIEVLHQFLLRRFEENAELHPDDVLVMMPNIEEYKPIIHAVFGTKQEGIPTVPYHVDYRRHSSETTTRSFLQLLDLADSRFLFSDVMDFLMEPVVHQSFDISESAVRRLKRWIEENNVIWGLNANHRKEEEQPGTASQTWQSAVHRGWSGIIYGDSSGRTDSESSLRFSDIQGQDMEEMWAGFSHMMAHFEQLNRSIKSKKATDEWCSLMESEIAYFFSSDSGVYEEKSHIRKALDAIRDESKAARFERKISYSMYRSHLRSLLDQQFASPAHFTRGITFSSMVPVRSIPAKIVALIGLNESTFPRKLRNTDFDLMASDPRPFERNPKNQDRSMFLESILASESFHYCSYIGRSRTDNESIPPSPIVSEWLTTLADLTGKKPEEILIEEPLHSFSPDNFRNRRSFSKTGYLTAKRLFDQSVSHSGLFQVSENPEEKESKILLVNALGNFISNPLKAYFREYFNPEMSSAELEKEEFDLNALEKHKLFERVFGWRLQDKSGELISDLLRKSGAIPVGWQGELVVRDLIQSVETAIESVGQKKIELSLLNVELAVDIDGLMVEGDFLSYSTQQFLDITPSSEAGDKFLKSWIKHLAVQCSDLFPDKNSWFVCELKKGNPKWYEFAPVINPESELKRFISLYNRGLKTPLFVFPNASYEYGKQEARNKKEPLSKAISTFEGSDYSPYAENRDPYTTLMLGEDASFREKYLDPELQEAINVMLTHMEKK